MFLARASCAGRALPTIKLLTPSCDKGGGGQDREYQTPARVGILGIGDFTILREPRSRFEIGFGAKALPPKLDCVGNGALVSPF